MEKFIAGWAEMACTWSVNRTVAEVHALFYLSADPLGAEDVSTTLSVSRSNVSAGLRELVGLGLIRVRGDRKQYYESKMSPCEAFRIILDDHKRGVIDPAVDTFHTCLEEQKFISSEDSYTLDRMRDVVMFFDAAMPLYEQLRRLPNGSFKNLFTVTSALRQLRG